MDIQKMIEEEAERNSIYPNSTMIDEYAFYHLRQNDIESFQAGTNFIISKQPEILFDFFIWFRENGEKHIDMSVEKMIEIYLKDKNDGK